MFFDDKIVDDICKLPVCNNGGNDRLIWVETNEGSLSVKSAYFVERKILGKYTPDRTTMRKVWQLAVSLDIIFWSSCKDLHFEAGACHSSMCCSFEVARG